MRFKGLKTLGLVCHFVEMQAWEVVCLRVEDCRLVRWVSMPGWWMVNVWFAKCKHFPRKVWLLWWRSVDTLHAKCKRFVGLL